MFRLQRLGGVGIMLNDVGLRASPASSVRKASQSGLLSSSGVSVQQDKLIIQVGENKSLHLPY